MGPQHSQASFVWPKLFITLASGTHLLVRPVLHRLPLPPLRPSCNPLFIPPLPEKTRQRPKRLCARDLEAPSPLPSLFHPAAANTTLIPVVLPLPSSCLLISVKGCMQNNHGTVHLEMKPKSSNITHRACLKVHASMGCMSNLHCGHWNVQDQI